MRRRNNRYLAKSEINIVPLLDVLLVLVLIFMATAPIISESVNVDLPKASSAKTIAVTDNKPVIIEVAAAGIYTLIINQQRQTNLSEAQIIEQVKAQIKQNRQTIFLIGGAKNVPYKEIIKALNALQTAGVKSVGLMTEPA